MFDWMYDDTGLILRGRGFLFLAVSLSAILLGALFFLLIALNHYQPEQAAHRTVEGHDYVQIDGRSWAHNPECPKCKNKE